LCIVLIPVEKKSCHNRQGFFIREYLNLNSYITFEDQNEPPRGKPLPDPTRDGYTFTGWFTGEAADSDDWSFSGDTVRANMTLYVRRTLATPPVTELVNFDSGAGHSWKARPRQEGGTIGLACKSGPPKIHRKNNHTLWPIFPLTKSQKSFKFEL
jgi:uncharacterized repeat protein (TIGR02543 family)